MQIETYVPPCSTTATFVPDTFTKMDQSGMFYDAPCRLVNGRESLAVSAGAASLQKMAMKLARYLFLERASAAPLDTLLGASLFPVVMDIDCFKPAEAQQALVENRKQARLAVELRATFEADSLEDGMNHPAEQILSKALRSTEDKRVLDWLRAFSNGRRTPELRGIGPALPGASNASRDGFMACRTRARRVDYG